MEVSICLPSRGLIHSRTMEHVMDNIQHFSGQCELLMVHDKPIPDCFNYLIEKASGEYIWFVEEDMGFPDDALQRMFMDAKLHSGDAVAVDYPLGVDGNGHCLTERAGMILAGTGCTLVRTAVAKDIAPLVTDTLYHAVTMEPLDFEKADTNTVYGKHDIYMFREFKRRGYKVLRGDFDAWHYIVDKLGEPNTNNGSHSIRRRSFTD